MGRGKQDLSKKPYKDRSERARRYYEKRIMSNSKKKKKVRESQIQPPRVRDYVAEYELRKSKNQGRNPTWTSTYALNRKIRRGKVRNETLKIQISNVSEEELSLDQKRNFLATTGNYNVENLSDIEIESTYAKTRVLWNDHKMQGKKKKTFVKALVSFIALKDNK